MALPSARGWGPGWPNPETSKIVKLGLPGFGNAQRVRQEIAPIVEWLIRETERRGYHIRPDWTWGWANRPVRGTEDRANPVPSDHSWATALDLNAPANGMNRAGPGWAAQHAAGRTDMPAWLPPLWEAHGFEWGGDWHGRQDPMHMQFAGTPADAARIVATLTQPPKEWTDMATEAQLAAAIAKAVAPIAAEQKRQAAILARLDTDYLTSGKGVRQTIAVIDNRTADLVTGKRPTKSKS